jgi:cytochrome c biogenesis protein CcdA
LTTELILSVGALSLLDMLSPAIIGVTVYLLLSPGGKVFTRLLAYIATVAVLYFAVGALLMMGLGTVMESAADLFQSRAVGIALTIIGAALFIGSFFINTKKKYSPPRPKSKNVASMVALGVTTFAIEVATALPYFAAIGLMGTAELTPVEWVPLLASYNVIMVLPAIIFYLLHLILGRLMRHPLEKLGTKLANSAGSTLSWVMSIAGIILVLNNIDKF